MSLSFSANLDELRAAGVWPGRVASVMRRRPAARLLKVDVPNLVNLLEPEIARARRHGRSFGVIGFGSLSSEVATAIQLAVRETDRTAATSHGLVVLLPETDAAGLRNSVERLTSLVGIEASAVGAVSFPDDALTVGHLHQLLEAQIDATSPTHHAKTSSRDSAA